MPKVFRKIEIKFDSVQSISAKLLHFLQLPSPETLHIDCSYLCFDVRDRDPSIFCLTGHIYVKVTITVAESFPFRKRHEEGYVMW